jgi:transcription termination factor Rho
MDTSAEPKPETPAETESPDEKAARKPAAKKASGLNAMLLADLKSMAGGLGIAGAGSMKKADLVSAIKAAQSGGQSGQESGSPSVQVTQRERRSGPAGSGQASSGRDRSSEAASESAREAAPEVEAQPSDRVEREARSDAKQAPAQERSSEGQAAPQGQGQPRAKQNQNRQDQNRQDQNRQDQNRQDQNKQSQPKQNQPKQTAEPGQGSDAGSQPDSDADAQAGAGQADPAGEGEGGRRNRRRRGRDRTASRAATPGVRGEPDTTILEDDVLVPAAGILDVLDNYAFVRTSGYLPGVDDVYLSLSIVRKYGLRRGDAVLGQVRQPREGERKEKFNPMVRVDSVNGAEPDTARTRPEFASLTPVHPSQRLRLEAEPGNVVGRIVDLVAPLGKGQRALLVAPPKSGKTTLLHTIAAAITRNHPECHLMVVLVDERPEEVTEFQRSVKGEVIASTLDLPAGDHTLIAELAIERAKRLVELGNDVVVLLDGLTRLGRAYNTAATGGGHTLPGGLDPSALLGTKRFFGAARSLEGAGSLTIIATASAGTGSKTDEALLEEFSDGANAVVRIESAPLDERLVPAIDVLNSSTRRDEHLLSDQERDIIRGLRRSWADMLPLEALASLHARVRGSATNIELLRKV